MRLSFPSALLLAACSAPDAEAPAMAETAQADRVAVEEPSPAASPATTMPVPLRGEWREDDLSRAPTAEDCQETSRTNRNFGKVLTVRADGYAKFEEGAKIVEVHRRTDSMIDATFEVFVGPGSRSMRKDFALQPGGTLAVNHDDGDGRLDVVQYRPCPAAGG